MMYLTYMINFCFMLIFDVQWFIWLMWLLLDMHWMEYEVCSRYVFNSRSLPCHSAQHLIRWTLKVWLPEQFVFFCTFYCYLKVDPRSIPHTSLEHFKCACRISESRKYYIVSYLYRRVYFFAITILLWYDCWLVWIGLPVCRIRILSATLILLLFASIWFTLTDLRQGPEL